MKIKEIQVIAPNFKKRLSGVTSTIIQLVPIQQKLGCKIVATGGGLPKHVETIPLWKLLGLHIKPNGAKYRVWHARRNSEMLVGIILKCIMRMPLKLVFTSASQRHHTKYTKFLIRQMDHVVAPSQRNANYLDVPATIVNHGIDPERFTPAEDKAALRKQLGLKPDIKYVGCFGRLRPSKGTDLFVEAMIEVLKDRTDWRAIILGRATPQFQSFKDKIIARIEQENMQDRILFLGEHNNIEDWYKILDLYIAPQRYEGVGLTPIEAMACGVPVIATAVGAFSEMIIEGKTGTIIEPENIAAMVAAAKKYMDDDKLRADSAKASIKHLQTNFTLESEAKSLIKIYNALGLK